MTSIIIEHCESVRISKGVRINPNTDMKEEFVTIQILNGSDQNHTIIELESMFGDIGFECSESNALPMHTFGDK